MQSWSLLGLLVVACFASACTDELRSPPTPDVAESDVVVDPASADADTLAETTSDVSTDADEDPGSDLASDGLEPEVDAGTEFSEFWDGENWAEGACRGMPFPDSTLGAWGTREEMTIDSEGEARCFCWPGVCIEVPPLWGLRGYVRFDRRNHDAENLRIDSPVVGLWYPDEDEELIKGYGPWRVALRAHPEETLGGLLPAHSRPFIRRSYGRRTQELSEPPFAQPEPGVFIFDWEFTQLDNTPQIFIGHEPFGCGDGVIDTDAGEECDPGSAFHRICDDECQISGPYVCEGDPMECRPICDDVECEARVCQDVTCKDEVGECIYQASRTQEGKPCVDGDATGWCRAGECVPEPVECGFCEGGRMLGGVCYPQEEGMTFSHATSEEFFYGGNQSRWVYALRHDTVLGRWPTRGVTIDEGWYEIAYITEALDDEHEHYLQLPELGLEFGPAPEASTLRVPISDFSVPRCEGSECEEHIVRVPAYAEFRVKVFGTRISENGFGIENIGIDVDGEWEICHPSVGHQYCTLGGVDTNYNDLYCGDCGNRCDEGNVCEGGVCLPDPILRQIAPDWLDGCPDNVFGHDCDQPCVVGTNGEVCSGVGTCSDGVFGTGRCTCDEGFHGVRCEFSCSDRVRNGREQAVDCGGASLCGACADYFE